MRVINDNRSKAPDAPAARAVDEIQQRQVHFDTDIDSSYQNRDEIPVHKSNVTSSTGFEEATDGMGAIAFSAEKDCGFYGMIHLLFEKLQLHSLMLRQVRHQISPLSVT